MIPKYSNEELNELMCDEDFWNVAFSTKLSFVSDPDVKELMKSFREVSKSLAKKVGYRL